MTTHICFAVTDDADGRTRWAHAWRSWDPSLRVVARFYGTDAAAEARAVSWARSRLIEACEEDGAAHG